MQEGEEIGWRREKADQVKKMKEMGDDAQEKERKGSRKKLNRRDHSEESGKMKRKNERPR